MIKTIIFTLLSAFAISASAAELIFQNNVNLSDGELRDYLNLPDNFDNISPSSKRLIAQISKANVENAYRQSGYFNASVNYRDSMDTDSTLYFIYDIRESNRFRFKDILIVLPDEAKMLINTEALRAQNSKFYHFEDIEEDLAEILNVYKENGYLNAGGNQSIQVDPSMSIVNVTFNIQPGNQIRFKSLNINLMRGSEYNAGKKNLPGISSVEYIRTLWNKKEGEIITEDYYQSFKSKLVGTRIFKQVRLANDSATNSEITVTLIEKVPGSLKSSIFFDPLNGPGISSGISYKNFNGRFHQMGLSGRTMGWGTFGIYDNAYEVSLNYAHPLVLKQPLRFENDFTVLKEPITSEDYDQLFKISNEGSFSRRFSNLFSLKSAVDLSSRDVTYSPDVSQEKQDSLESSFNREDLKFESIFNFNWTNNITFPTRGYKARILIGNSGPFNMEERFSYAKIENKFYYPLAKFLHLAFAADYGRFFQEAATEIDSRIFYLGGFRSVRGYKSRTIKPTLDDNSGTQPNFIRTAFEFRIIPYRKRLQNFQLVPFFDWGRVWDTDPSYTPGKGSSLGLGFRYKWQILMLRVDFTLKQNFNQPFDFSEKWKLRRIDIDLSQAI